MARVGAVSATREFAAGFATLGRGFAFWRRRPALMTLGLLPAAIVGAVIVTAIVLLIVFLDPLTLTLTGFAGGWDAGWRGLLRIVLGVALVVAVLALAARTFTAITLLVGGPFYDRIQDAAESAAELPAARLAERPLGVGAMIAATLVLVLQSLGASVVVLLVGLIPVVGQVAAPVLAFLFTAAALTRELTLSPFARRGLDRAARRRLRRGRAARSFGFGVAVQVCYLVPLGAVLTMPAAVAGATLLAHDLLAAEGEPATSSAG